MSDAAIIATAAFTLIGTICGGFFALVNRQDKTHKKIAVALDNVAKSNRRIADEAKQRNGHLADLIIKTADKPVNVQTVETQLVKEQR